MAGAQQPASSRESDDEAFKRELVQLIPHLRAFARTLCGDPAAADDLAQDAMMKAWDARASFQMGYEEVPDAHHDHLIDLQTGQVIEFRNEDIERLQRVIAEELGFELVDHRLELYGVPKGGKKPTGH